MKKNKRFALLTAGILIAFLLIIIGGYKYKTGYARTEVAAYRSEDRTYELIIYQIGEPQAPFGPGKCRLVLTRDGRRVDERDFILYNDGKWPGAENFVVSWTEEGVSVLVSGEEQEDATYVLSSSGC